MSKIQTQLRGPSDDQFVKATYRFQPNLPQRIKVVIDVLGEHRSIRTAGKSWKQLNRYASGDNEPTREVLELLSKSIGGSKQWLDAGEMHNQIDKFCEFIFLAGELRVLEKMKATKSTEYFPDVLEALIDMAEFLIEDIDSLMFKNKLDDNTGKGQLLQKGSMINIPRYDAHLSAGDGHLNDHKATLLDYIPFTREFLQKKLNRSSIDDLSILEATGDSMLPTISDGDLVLIDESDKTEIDGIFAYVQGDFARIKRLRFMMGGKIEIVSDNEIYSSETLSRSDLEQFHIIGRVRWVGHTV